MKAILYTDRDRGVQTVEGGCSILDDPNAIFLSPHWEDTIIIALGEGQVRLQIDEVRAIAEFLRSKGIEIDPIREKQRKVAWALVQSFGPMPSGEGKRASTATEGSKHGVG
jgi:hypothetical protein